MSNPVPRRRILVRLALQTVAAGVAVAVTVVLAESPASGAFSAQTGSSANSATAASNFCAAPGGGTLTPSADSTGYQSNPTVAYGDNVSVGALSANGANARAVLRFSLPTLPDHCEITSATLRLRASAVAAGRTIDVYRVDPAAALWSEASLSWNSLPPVTATAVGSASLAAAGWQEWTVTGMLPSLYAGVNNGFLVRDRVENSSPAKTQVYDSRDSATPANRPQLVLTWG